MPLLPPTRLGGGGGGGRSREGRRPREPDWPLLISLKEIARPRPVTQPNWVMQTIWKGKSRQFSSSPSHPPTPHPVTGATSAGIYYPGRRSLGSGSHLEAGTPTPTPAATASQDARSLPLPASAGAPGNPRAVPAQCPESCRLKGRAGAGHRQAEGSRLTEPLRRLCLGLAARPGGVEPKKASDHSLAETESLQNRQPASQPLQQTLPS